MRKNKCRDERTNRTKQKQFQTKKKIENKRENEKRMNANRFVPVNSGDILRKQWEIYWASRKMHKSETAHRDRGRGGRREDTHSSKI